MKDKRFLILTGIFSIFVLYLYFANDLILLFDSNEKLHKQDFSSYNEKNIVYQSADGFEYLGGLYETAYIQGWAFCETDYDNADKTISLIFVSEDKKECYGVSTKAQLRPDVYGTFRDTLRIYNALVGVECQFSTINMKCGIYKYYIWVYENDADYGIVDTGIWFEKNINGLHQIETPLNSEKTKQIDLISEDVAVKSYLDIVRLENQQLTLEGWAFVQNFNCERQKVYVVFDKRYSEVFTTTGNLRMDVANAFENEGYSMSGFTVTISVEDFSYGEHTLLLIPSQAGGVTLLMPLAAGIAAFLLVVAQNKIAPLQKEQEKAEQIMTGAISVGISLFLGAFVSLGTGVYWIASNLFSILNQLVCNALIKPDKYIDYQALAESKKELAEMSELGSKISPEDKKREKADYKRFFSVANKHLVFYSESSGFYKYYQGIIEYLLSHSNVTIHYVTSDPKDAIFQMAETNKQIRAYYIGEKKLITLFMKMDADMVVMTMPDIENFHIKRSYVRKDIEYVYIPHGIDSINLTMRTGCIDHYDTVFCVGKHHNEEIEKTEEVYGLPRKKLIDFGYCLLDSMREAYWSKEHEAKEEKTILIAPSWQTDNIVDTCLDEMLVALSGHGYHIIVRPHPQQVRHCPVRMEQLKARFANHSDIEIQTDFSSNSTVFEADMVITDWSGIAYEYAFTTYKPVIFVDTPMKVMNPEYKRINVEPMSIWMRKKIGQVVAMGQVGEIAKIVADVLMHKGQYSESIQKYADEYIYNLGASGEVGAKYMLQSLKSKQEGKRNA